MRVLVAFRANQALLLAGAIAYYTLLSIVPLLILVLIGLSEIVNRGTLLATVGRYLSLLIPGQSAAVVTELSRFLDRRGALGWVLLATMIISSSLAFTVTENAMSVIFLHRVATRRRHFLVSAVIPYFFMLLLGTGLLLMTLVSGFIQTIGTDSLHVLGRSWPLLGTSGALLYLLGVIGEILVLMSVYLVMPVGPLSWRHALLGAVVATALWEITRHLLIWYFTRLSQVSVVYGSLATAIVVLAGLDVAASCLLLGAQVVSEYERTGLMSKQAIPQSRRQGGVAIGLGRPRE